MIVATVVGLLGGSLVSFLIAMFAFGIGFVTPGRWGEILLYSAPTLGIAVAYGIGKSLWKDFKTNGN